MSAAPAAGDDTSGVTKIPSRTERRERGEEEKGEREIKKRDRISEGKKRDAERQWRARRERTEEEKIQIDVKRDRRETLETERERKKERVKTREGMKWRREGKRRREKRGGKKAHGHGNDNQCAKETDRRGAYVFALNIP